jgi:hypothetical protein
MSNTVQKEPGNTTPNYPTYLTIFSTMHGFAEKLNVFPSILPPFPPSPLS